MEKTRITERGTSGKKGGGKKNGNNSLRIKKRGPGQKMSP